MRSVNKLDFVAILDLSCGNMPRTSISCLLLDCFQKEMLFLVDFYPVFGKYGGGFLSFDHLMNHPKPGGVLSILQTSDGVTK